jgi:hypothetical protein
VVLCWWEKLVDFRWKTVDISPSSSGFRGSPRRVVEKIIRSDR